MTYHYYSYTPTYKSWIGLKQRCCCKTSSDYKRYGAKGIKVCKRWVNSFENFLKDMGERPLGMTLDRKNNLKGYYKRNCKWSTPKEQSNNTSTNKKYRFKGKILNMTQWADEFKMPKSTLFNRLKRGMSLHEALTTPVKERLTKALIKD